MPEFSRYRLEAAIADAAREAFLSAVADNPDHEFFAFALTTLSDVEYIECSLNSARNLEKILSKANEANLRRHFPSDEAMRHYYKWYPNEWGDFEYYEQRGRNFFAPVQSLLMKIEECARVKNFDARRKYVFDSMISALQALDGEGCFGGGETRRERIVFADVYDDEAAPELRNRSIHEINAGKTSPTMIEDFRGVRRA